MKILFVPSTFLPSIGGAEIQAHNLANMLAQKDINIGVICFKKKSPTYANIIKFISVIF